MVSGCPETATSPNTLVSEPVDPLPGTDYRPTLSALTEAHASVVVLLSEGYDGGFVRAVLEQVRQPPPSSQEPKPRYLGFEYVPQP